MESQRPDREFGSETQGWKFATKFAYSVPFVLAGTVLALIVVGIVVAVVVWREFFPSADAGKARSEVQRYYDARLPGRVDVRSCRYTPSGDSDFDTFRCNVATACTRVVQFSVPRAATDVRVDFDPLPLTRRPLVFRCVVQPAER
jgi:hypothetical protein